MKFFNKHKESRSGAVFSFYWKNMFLIVGFIRYGRESKAIGSLRSVFGSFSQENTSNRSKAVTGSGFSKKPQRWPNRPRRGSGLGKQRRSSPKSMLRSRLESRCPPAFNSNGMCPYSGTGYPRSLSRYCWIGVEDSRSLPRTTWVIPISPSSAAAAS